MENKDNYYIDKAEFNEIVRNAIKKFNETGKWGKEGDIMSEKIMLIYNKIKNKYLYIGYKNSYEEAMRESVLINIFSYLPKNLDENKDAFNYVTTIIINAFKSSIRKMNKRTKELSYDNDVIDYSPDRSFAKENEVLLTYEFEDDLIDKLDRERERDKRLEKFRSLFFKGDK